MSCCKKDNGKAACCKKEDDSTIKKEDLKVLSSNDNTKGDTIADDTRRAQVADYYGKQLTKSSDLKTDACCTKGTSMPKYIKECIANIHDDVVMKYYGCGLCLPSYDLTGARVLDLGSGSGRDVYIASQLVGPTGKVVGVDMTVEQLQVAISTQEYHANKFGFANVAFYQGTLEKLNEIPELELGSFDVIISNCVLNLCADKKAVLQHCMALLKEGGEMYFSDVYTNRCVPSSLQQDQLLWGECLSGALYWNDFITLAREVGFVSPARLVESAPITVDNRKLLQVIDDVGGKGLKFSSATYRLWKISSSSSSSSHGVVQPLPGCEDYGQAVRYKGTLPRFPSGWQLDAHHYFEKKRTVLVCGNTWNILRSSPFLKPHFDFIGDFDCHFGIMQDCCNNNHNMPTFES